MVDVRKLDAVLPATQIESDRMAEVRGIVPGETLEFFEPPAGWPEPAVDPLHAFILAERAAGATPDAAANVAGAAVAELLPRLPAVGRPWLLDGYAERGARQTVAVSALAGALRARGHAALADYLADAADAAADTPAFRGFGCLGRRPVSLRALAARRAELGMQEFSIGIPMCAALSLLRYDDEAAERLGRVWYEATRPRIEALSAEVGAELYYYRDPEDDCDDDYAHRYLVLDHLCHIAPQSPYVAYLVEASGAASLADLREALLDPTSYAPGIDHGRYTEAEPTTLLTRFDHDAGPERTTGVVVGGPGGLDLARGAIRTRLGQRVVVVAGGGGLHGDLIEACERAKTRWRIRASLDEAACDAFVAGVDELWLFEAHMPVPPKNLSVPDPLLLDYEARARAAGVPVTVFTAQGYRRS